MKFWEAMKLVDEGKSVYRPKWGPTWVLRKSTEADVLVEEKRSTEFIKFAVISPVDAVASDWEVLD